MLKRLHIKNFILIKDLEIELNEGLTVLTGETGAGKSLIIDALNILCGAKASKSLIRNNEQKLEISALFTSINQDAVSFIKTKEIDYEDSLIISRIIKSSGESIYHVNDTLVTQSFVISLSSLLIDIHTQNDTLRLFNPKNYLSFIDDNTYPLLVKYQDSLKEYQLALKKLNDLLNREKEFNDNYDFVLYQYNELMNASLRPNEVSLLEEELNSLNNYENISSCLTNIRDLFDNDLIGNIDSLIMYLRKICNFDTKYTSYIEECESLSLLLNDLFHLIKADQSLIHYDDAKINSLNERLSLLKRLEKKYKKSIDELITFKDDLRMLIDDYENFDIYKEDLLKIV